MDHCILMGFDAKHKIGCQITLFTIIFWVTCILMGCNVRIEMNIDLRIRIGVK